MVIASADEGAEIKLQEHVHEVCRCLKLPKASLKIHNALNLSRIHFLQPKLMKSGKRPPMEA